MQVCSADSGLKNHLRQEVQIANSRSFREAPRDGFNAGPASGASALGPAGFSGQSWRYPSSEMERIEVFANH